MVERVKLLSIGRSLPADSWSELANDVYEDYMDDLKQKSKVFRDIFGDMSNIAQATGKQHRPPGFRGSERTGYVPTPPWRSLSKSAALAAAASDAFIIGTSVDSRGTMVLF